MSIFRTENNADNGFPQVELVNNNLPSQEGSKCTTKVS